MARIDVTTAFNPAVQHTGRILFKPFQFRKWLGMGFAAFIAYGLGSSGGGGGGNGSGVTNRAPGPPHVDAQIHQMVTWITQHAGVLIAAVVALVLLGLLWTWLASVFHFVYLDQITKDHGRIKEPFARLKGVGTSYFLWNLALSVVPLALLLLLFAQPIQYLLRHPGQTPPLPTYLVGSIVLIVVFLIIPIAIAQILVRDFVTAIMYARQIGVMQAWHDFLPLLGENAGQMLLYLLFLILIAIGIAMAGCMIVLLVGVIIFLPVFAIFWGLILLGATMGLSWTLGTVVAAILLGIVLFVPAMILMQTAMQPLTVFRRSFALAVLGQADQSLALIPTAPPNIPPYPR